MRNWINTPLGITVVVAVTVFATELAFMISLEDFIRNELRVPSSIGALIDAMLITLIAVPILYQRLNASEDKFRKISESAQDAVIMMGPDERISFWNKAAEITFGYTEKEALGENLHKLIATEESQKAFANGFHHFQKTGKGPIVGTLRELIAVRKGGAEFPAELSISATQINGQWHAIGIIRDITKRRQIERDLRESEGQYRALFETMLDGFAYCRMLYVDGQPRDFIYINVNAAFEKQTGLKNVIGKRVSEVVPGIRESDPELFETYGRVAKGGKPEQFEIYLKSLGMWFFISVYSPKPDHFVAVFDVITERKQSEEALIASRDLLQSVVENAPLRVFWKDTELNYLGCNTAFAKDAGMEHTEDIVGKDDYQMGWSAQAELYRADDKIVMDSGVPKLMYEEPQTTPDGHTIWLSTSKVPLRNSAGKIIGLLGIYEDITERKKMELAMKSHEVALAHLNQDLQEDKEKIEKDVAGDEALLSSLGEGMISTDTEGRISIMNRMAEKMLGWTEAEVLGKVATEIIPAVEENGDAISPEKRICLIVAQGESTETLSEPTYLIKKDGEMIPVMETATPVIINGEKTGAVIIIRDITEEKEIEKTRGDLLALASHQLRTPLSGTKWLIETLQSGLKGPLLSEQKEYLDEIYKINQRMTSLVVDMLGVLRIEGGSIAINKGKISTGSIFDSIVETFDSVAKAKQLTLRTERDGEETIETDPLLLRNILESFISNALNYSNPGGEIVVALKKESQGLVFSVKDLGIGIPKDEQKQLFERFYRASNAKTFNTKGTGLGLYIAATLAKKIGAHLSFESEEGKGSTFFVHLPATV